MRMQGSDVAAVRYLPDVNASMSKPAFWSDKQASPDKILAGCDEISKINQTVLKENACCMVDLAAVPEGDYSVSERSAVLKKAAESDAEYCYKRSGEGGLNARYDENGTEINDKDLAWQKIYSPMIDNCADSDTEVRKPVLFAICTSRTEIRSFPDQKPLPDAPDNSDPDFDVQYLSAVSLGEPLVSRGVSSDKKFYHVQAGYVEGWIPAEDIAICADKKEWLAAWQFSPEQSLVVYDDKMYTGESNSSPEVSKKMLTMGCRLKLAEKEETEGRISNRASFNNYVVWIPVRKSDGTYARELALIPEHCRVWEGFLPLTAANLAKVMFNQLGDAYGWGGMLGTQDCSGYIRDVYRCFGLEMARDSSSQAAEPVKKFDLKGKSDQEKAEIIKTLPLGTELVFAGHVMLYLGSENNKLYVINSVSSLVVDGILIRVRGTVINTLDITRPNGSRWISNLHTALIPYCDANAATVPGMAAK